MLQAGEGGGGGCGGSDHSNVYDVDNDCESSHSFDLSSRFSDTASVGGVGVRRAPTSAGPSTRQPWEWEERERELQRLRSDVPEMRTFLAQLRAAQQHAAPPAPTSTTVMAQHSAPTAAPHTHDVNQVRKLEERNWALEMQLVAQAQIRTALLIRRSSRSSSSRAGY
eukprot:6210212-Pleurochrysis_carterae.AAC.2